MDVIFDRPNFKYEPNNFRFSKIYNWGWGGGSSKGWLAIAKLKPFSFFISLLFMLKKAFDNVKIEK